MLQVIPKFYYSLEQQERSKSAIIFIVTIAMFLDSILLTCLVPLAPILVYNLEHPNSTFRDAGSTAKLTHSKIEKLNGLAVIIHPQTSQEDLMDQPIKVGILLASKSIVNLIMNPLIGMWTHKIGLTIPFFLGFVIFFISTLCFALFANTYALLLAARAVQGIGSSCTHVAGMAMIAEIYSGKRREAAFSFLIGAVAIGFIVGPVYGGLLYELSGESILFIILAILALLDGCLQLIVLRPKVEPSKKEPTFLITLLRDPYILLTAGAITIANLSFGVLEPSLPIRLMNKMDASSLQVGLIYVASLMGYMVSTRTTTYLSNQVPQWLIALIGLIMLGLFLIMMNYSVNLVQTSVPCVGYGFAVGIVDVVMMPSFGRLADIRHTGVYGNVYAIGDFAWAAAYSIGPVIGGTLMQTVGFEWVMYIVATICFLYAPFLLFLRRPLTPAEKDQTEEKNALLETEREHDSEE